MRSRSVGRVLRALLTYLSADLTPLDAGLVHLNATAAVRNGEAMLLPPNLVWIKELQPRLARKGIALVDAPYASVDPARRMLVVPQPSVGHDARLLDGLLGREPKRSGSELSVLPGEYPLTAWFLACEKERQGQVSPGLALASGLPLVIGRDIREAGEMLVPLMTEITSTAVYFETPADLVAALG